MVLTHPLELDSSPLQEVETTLDVASEEGVLGSTGERLIIKQAEVSLGRLLVFRLSSPSNPAVARLLPGPGGAAWRFYLVVFPFTLHPLPAGSTYEKVTFAVSLDDAAVTAFDLMPDKVVDEQEHQRTFKLGFKLPLQVGAAEAGMEDQVVLKDLRPLITSFGVGESRFYWLYTHPGGVEPGTTRVAAILQLPDAVRHTTATVEYDFSLKRRLFSFGDPVVNPAWTEPWKVELSLD